MATKNYILFIDLVYRGKGREIVWNTSRNPKSRHRRRGIYPLAARKRMAEELEEDRLAAEASMAEMEALKAAALQRSRLEADAVYGCP